MSTPVDKYDRPLPRRRLVRKNLTPVVIFFVVTSLMSAVVALTFGKVQIRDNHSYTAVFSDVSGLASGVDVRIAGVSIGRVNGIHLRPDARVDVDFDIASNIKLSTATEATIKYANLTGDRYVELSQGTPGAPALKPGGTIPVADTKPALDLDKVFGGFQPLVQGLDPAELNNLTKSIIAVANGQGSAVEALLGNIASITNTLADKDQVIGSVIDNLNTVLGTVATRDTQLDHLITGLNTLMGGLAKDRKTIGNAVARVNRLATGTTLLTSDLSPGLHDVFTQTQRAADLILSNVANTNYQLSLFPQALTLLSRAGAYGSFFNFYLCAVRFKLSDDGAAVPIYTPYIMSKEPRCQK
jgi:phospholipid/cholesterol/gamma-HCH transport system substrate-binding protein